ncbi:MAG: CGNR zinc finger domain-containing protein [Actinobacteria bacterium]|nr:CGNR zinc finger domain-containing protein [Actinomycetota bacterium]
MAPDAVELLGAGLATRIRRCQGQGCSALFLDTSRGGTRRRCTIGNRIKVAAHRSGKDPPEGQGLHPSPVRVRAAYGL